MDRAKFQLAFFAKWGLISRLESWLAMEWISRLSAKQLHEDSECDYSLPTSFLCFAQELLVADSLSLDMRFCCVTWSSETRCKHVFMKTTFVSWTNDLHAWIHVPLFEVHAYKNEQSTLKSTCILDIAGLRCERNHLLEEHCRVKRVLGDKMFERDLQRI